MKQPTHHRRTDGSALLAVLMTTFVLSVITGTVLMITLNRRNTVSQSSVWEEALAAAEAGIHQGAAQLEQALAQNKLPENPQLNVGQTFTLDLPHAGEDSNASSVTYTITRNNVVSGSMLRPYYSIVSTGTVAISGARSLSSDTRDIILRKLNLAGSTRTATRKIEAWFRPVYNTDSALKTDGPITLNNSKIYVDGFNSGDASRSIHPGLPGTTIGQFNIAPYNVMLSHVATNSEFLDASNATIFGDALTNGGTPEGTTGIQGEIRDDFYEPLAPVYAPDWATSVTPGLAVLTAGGKSTKVETNVRTSGTMRGGTEANPGRYVLDSVALSGSGDIITFDKGLSSAGTVDPAKGFVELYVRGDFTTKGGGTSSSDSGSVVILNGVQVKLWVLGNLNFSGNGLTNHNNLASSFSLYAVNAPNPVANQTVTLAGTSQFFGSVYAPGAALKLAGGGSNGTFVGNLVGKTAFMNGNTSIRYDEALSGGLITRFTLVSWFEDTKKQGSFTGLLQ